MSLVSRSIPNLINGISQQPASLRLPSQGELQENGFSSVADGLGKRFPFEHIAKILTGDYESSKLHMINRDTTERYAVVADGTTIRVFDLTDGTEKTVTTPDGVGYITTAAPETDLSMVSIADTTFITNKATTVALNAADADIPTPSALVFIKQGVNSTDYTVSLDGTSYTYTSAASGQVSTKAVATALVGAFPGTFTTQLIGSIFYIRKTDNSAFTFSVTDSFGEQGMSGVKDVIQKFSLLPPKAIEPMFVKVAGDTESGRDDYYLKWSAEGEATNGSWVETRLGGMQNSFDPSTMPHKLVRNGDGTFTFSQITWDERLVGDTDTVPAPTFVGKTINDIFFYRNRLGVISDENIVLSRAGDFFNFWPETVTEVLDDDPIDLGVSHMKVSILKHAIPFHTQLLLTSDQTQFILDAEGNMTPANAKLDQSTEFEVSPDCKPVGAGPNVYFAVKNGQYTHFREYYLSQDTVTNDAANVTSHCPSFVPENVFQLASSNSMDVVAALTRDERNAIYVYQFYWQTETKIQSAWHKWLLPANEKVLAIEFMVSDFYALIQRTDGVYLEKMGLDSGYFNATLGFNVLLDRKVTLTGTYDPVNNWTDITIPYPDDGDFLVVPADVSNAELGSAIFPARPDSTTLRVTGDYSGQDLVCGRQYMFRYKFSTQYPRERTSDGETSLTDGRLQLRTMSLSYADTGYFFVEVTPRARETYSYVMTGRTLGSSNLILGQAVLETGVFRFPIYTKNEDATIEVKNDMHLPVNLQSASWEGTYVSRSQRV